MESFIGQLGDFTAAYPWAVLLIATLVIFGLRLLGVSKRGITWIGAAVLVIGALFIANNVQ